MYSVGRTHAMVTLGILSTAFGPVERTSSAPYWSVRRILYIFGVVERLMGLGA